MSIQPLVLTAMLLSPIATMADGYQHQRRYSTHRTCYKDMLKPAIKIIGNDYKYRNLISAVEKDS